MRSASKPRRVYFSVLLVFVVLSVHGWYLSRKVREISTEAFEKQAVQLRTDPKWSIGYVQGVHGAVLVKSHSPVQPLRTARRGSADLDRAMSNELSSIPKRFTLEAVLYVALIVWCLFGVLPVSRKLVQFGLFRSRSAIVLGLLTAVTVSIAALPMLSVGYGGSAYSTWVGPGAMSSSGPYLRYVGRNVGETISYRPFVEVILLVPSFVGGLLSTAADSLFRTDFWFVVEGLLPGTDGAEFSWVLYNWVVIFTVYFLLGLLASKAHQRWLAA